MTRIEASEPAPMTLRVFHYVGGFLLIIGVALLVLHLALPSSFGQSELIISVVLIVIAGGFLVYPRLLRSRTETAGAFNLSVRRAMDVVADVDGVRRAYFKLEQELEGIHRALLEEAQKAVDSSSRVRGVEQELLAVRQQLRESELQSSRWVDAVQRFLESIERTLAHEKELSEDYLSATERALGEFLRAVEPLGFRCVRPSRGEPFDDRAHMAVGSVEDEVATGVSVLSCSNWGFAQAGHTLRKAGVIVALAPSLSGAATQSLDALADDSGAPVTPLDAEQETEPPDPTESRDEPEGKPQ